MRGTPHDQAINDSLNKTRQTSNSRRRIFGGREPIHARHARSDDRYDAWSFRRPNVSRHQHRLDAPELDHRMSHSGVRAARTGARGLWRETFREPQRSPATRQRHQISPAGASAVSAVLQRVSANSGGTAPRISGIADLQISATRANTPPDTA